MSETGTPLAEADYIGAGARELSEKRAGAKVAAGISQKTLFHRRGFLETTDDRAWAQRIEQWRRG